MLQLLSALLFALAPLAQPTATLIAVQDTPGQAQDVAYPISWLDASGTITTVVAQLGTYGSPRVSPDGELLAYSTASNPARRARSGWGA